MRLFNVFVTSVFLSTAACLPSAECPEGFLEDNAGNCIQVSGDDGVKPAAPASADPGSDDPDPPGDAPEAYRLTVHNDSIWDVAELYVSSCTSDSWGPDQLEEGILYSGNSFVLTGITEGCYDMQAWDFYGYAWERMGQQFNQDIEWTLTD